MKVKLFTHTDLDGVSCAILAYKAFGRELVDVSYCNYNDINEKVSDFINSVEDYDMIFITDISVNEDIANLINETISDRVVLLDHHKTATWLNNYEWANVEIYKDAFELTCGTELLYDYLISEDLLFDGYCRYVNMVSDYDTWRWAETDSIKPKQLNDLLKIWGRNEFVDEMLCRLCENSEIITEQDLTLLAFNQKQIDLYINKKNKSLYKNNWRSEEGITYKAGFTFADNYTSELGNKLCELNPELDFVAIINIDQATCSLRGAGRVDLSAIAKASGGGGHFNASGFPLHEMLRTGILNKIFN